MAGLEVKNIAFSPVVAHSASKHLSAGKPADKYGLIRPGNIKVLSVHLFRRKSYTGWYAFCDRVPLAYRPHQLLVVALPPVQRAGRPHQPCKRLRHMCGVERNKSHSLIDPADNLFRSLIGNLLLGNVGPVYQYIRLLQDFPG